MSRKLTICVAGKNNIAVDILEKLIENNFDRYDLVVCCNRDETGTDSWQRSLRRFACLNNIKELTLQKLYEIENLIFLSIEFDRIIRTKKFKTKRLYNIHFSLLPAYKGMYTSVFPILNGDSFAGVTFHEIDDGIDTGKIIAQQRFSLHRECTCRELYLKFIKNGTLVVIDNLENIISNNYLAVEQSAENSTYYSSKAVNYAELNIDLHNTAEIINRQIRAFSFREYQLPTVNNKSIISTTITKERSYQKPGTIIEENNQGIKISTVDYYIWLYYDRLEELLDACQTNDLPLVKDICSVKEHINQYETIYGWTPLMAATYHNNIEIVKYLLINGADINAVDYDGKNLLMYAKDVFMEKNDGTLFDLYLNLGIEPTRKDYSGHDLYFCAKNNEKLKRYLMREDGEFSKKVII